MTSGQIDNSSFWLIKMSHDLIVKKICQNQHVQNDIWQGSKKTKMEVFLIEFFDKKTLISYYDAS